MTSSREFQELASAFQAQFERLPAARRNECGLEIKSAMPALNLTLLRPEGLLALCQPGEPDVVASPRLHWLYRRASDEDPASLCLANQTLAERHQAQAPLRQAWEADLAARYPGVAARVDRSAQALEAVARDQPCLSELIAARLECAPDRLGRILQPLREAGWVEERRVVGSLDTPESVLRLMPAGWQQARERGLRLPETLEWPEPALLAERLFCQKIASVYLRAWPSAQVSLAGSAAAPLVASPLGPLRPDLLVEAGERSLYVEAESGRYDFPRLGKKLDNYLACPTISEVWVIAERDDAPTEWQVIRWHEINLDAFPKGVPRNSTLTVHFTRFTWFRQHSQEARIWHTLRLPSLYMPEKSHVVV
jgi:hypothetical protein